MFDDSKRLDALEGQVAALQKQVNQTIDQLNKNVEVAASNDQAMVKAHEGLATLTQKNIEQLRKEIIEVENRLQKKSDEVNQLSAQLDKVNKRCANLEAVVSKLKK